MHPGRGREFGAAGGREARRQKKAPPLAFNGPLGLVFKIQPPGPHNE